MGRETDAPRSRDGRHLGKIGENGLERLRLLRREHRHERVEVEHER